MVDKIIRSNRRTIAIQISPDGSLIVRAPQAMSEAKIRQFVESKAHWIEKHQTAIKQRQACAQPPLSADELCQLSAAAKGDLAARVAKYAQAMGVSYGRITIRAQRTRWGSCSAKGNLNFNCLLMLCPEAVRDYVVVHELCHLKELNHSKAFWQEVARILPGYTQQKQWLKANGPSLIRRLG